MITELVQRVFASRNAAHLQHWASKSYAEHVALGDFYDGVIGKIDSIVEAYQGIFGLIDKADLKDVSTDKDIHDLLKADLIWINKHRDKLAKDITPIENMVDELMALYMSTLYKLENLK